MAGGAGGRDGAQSSAGSRSSDDAGNRGKAATHDGDKDTGSNKSELRLHILKLALSNAQAHGGRTMDKAVLGKILGARPDLRSSVRATAAAVSDAVARVNAMTPQEQRQELEEIGPLTGGKSADAAAEPRDVRKTDDALHAWLPPLPDLPRGSIVKTRFPPEPNGYPHIGHAKAAIINLGYARMYGGTCTLRMDDTNPETERMEYHAAINVGLEWLLGWTEPDSQRQWQAAMDAGLGPLLGLKFDQKKSTSDDMEYMYKKGEEMIRSGDAYVCTCKKEEMGRRRRERAECKCCKRDDADEHHKRWTRMHEKFKPGEAVVRFRGDMSADNAVMRDPVLFRVIDTKHYTRGTAYRVWPSYDMSVAIEDSRDGITHAFRSKEFEARAELINAILDALNMRKPRQGFFSRLEFDGMPTSKRVIRPLIEDGKVHGYDDPRIPTLEGLRKRGISPMAVCKFIMSLGMTKADTIAPFEALESFNRNIIDGESTRLFMVRGAAVLIIDGLPEDLRTVRLQNHPLDEEMGRREIAVDGKMYIPAEDAKRARRGDLIKLLGLAYVRVESVTDDEDADVGTAPIPAYSTGTVRHASVRGGEIKVCIRGTFEQPTDDGPAARENRRRAGVPQSAGRPGAGRGATVSDGKAAPSTGEIKVQWVPCDTALRINLVIPKKPFKGEEFDDASWEETEVYTESHYAELEEGAKIQFVRFGYCRKDTDARVIFTHG